MKFKKIFASLIILLGSMMANTIILPAPLVLAQAGSSLTCGDLANPDKIKNIIITILEERVIPQGQTVEEQTKGNTDVEGIIPCFRETSCKLVTDPKGSHKVCEQVKYTGTCKPIDGGPSGDSVICQPVQILYAQSGATIIYTYIGLIYRWTAGTAGIVTVLYLVIGGIGIATAQGDSGRLEKAKERVMNSVAGLVLLFLSALILYSINPNFFTR